jgi:hypothetical protein
MVLSPLIQLQALISNYTRATLAKIAPQALHQKTPVRLLLLTQPQAAQRIQQILLVGQTVQQPKHTLTGQCGTPLLAEQHFGSVSFRQTLQ